MEIIETDSNSYAKNFPNPTHIFNSAEFNEINRHKVENIYYLIFKDTKVRLGIILGTKKNILNSPFSAPFGGFDFTSEDIKIKEIDESLSVFYEWLKHKEFNQINIIHPPIRYQNNFYTKMHNCLFRHGYLINQNNINYHFELKKFDESYEQIIKRNAKKNLRISLKSKLIFKKIDSIDGKLAYNIIAKNRKQKGFPLRMTWEQIQKTMKLVDVDFFLVTKDQIDIASALVYFISPKIARVVYWGDLSEYNQYKTMNFLSFKIFEYYKNLGLDFIDIGISTEKSIPNYGLCEFKESIGCDISTEYIHTLSL